VDITVRETTPQDAEGILTILNPIIETKKYSVMIETFTLEEEISFIKNFPKRGVFHVAIAGDKVVGFQVVEPFSTLRRVAKRLTRD
jgi:L-amino acid N-acyltransferase YncA